MGRTTAILACGSMIAAAFLAFNGAPSAAAQEPTYRVGIYQNAPKIFIGEDGTATGFFPEILDEVARLGDFKLTYVPCQWVTCLTMLEAGSIDIMPDVAWSEDRAARYRFGHEPVFHSWSHVYRQAGSSVTKMADFNGKRIAVLQDSVQHRTLLDMQARLNQRFDIMPTPSHRSTLLAVDGGAADIGIVNHLFGRQQEKKFDVERTPIVFAPSALFLAYAAGFPDERIAAIDVILSEFKSDGRSPYYRAVGRWLSDEAPGVLPEWVPWLAYIAAGALLLSIVGNAVLRHQVSVRTSAYRDAVRAAEAANRIKTQFLAHISHELRTPLNAILGFSDILADQRLGPDRQDKYREYARDIHASGQHLLELVNDLLDLSTIEAGKQQIKHEHLVIGDIVDESLNVIRQQADQKRIRLYRQIPDGLPTLFADRRIARQILLNLLTNAVKFTQEGGEVQVRVATSGPSISLIVADNGPGIVPEKLPKLTDPFVRGEQDAYKSAEGWGLGLTITRSLIDLHQGTLLIESTLGEGTTVTVTFPGPPEA